MNKKFKQLSHFSLFFIAVSWTQIGAAVEYSFADCHIASNEELDELRGGFEVDVNGVPMKIAFSMESVSYVNNQLVASTKFNVADTSNLTQQQLSNLGKTINVIQNGVGNVVILPPNSKMVGGTILQNKLDNQDIRNVTTLNVSIANQALARSMLLNEAVNQGISRSIR